MPAKILNINVNFMDGYANDARFTVLVDAAPAWSAYTKHPVPDDAGFIYIATDGALVTFFYYDPTSMSQGFGHWRREVQLVDGSSDLIVGGWSSSGKVVSGVVHWEVVDAAYVTDLYPDGRWPGGAACGVDGAVMRELLAHDYPGVTLTATAYGWTALRPGESPRN